MQHQATIQNPVSIQPAMGLFTGHTCGLELKPAPANTGIVFIRTDLKDTEIPALIKYVTPRARRTAIKNGEAVVETIEHIMSAIAASRIDNLRVLIDGPEVPILDGSARPFFDALKQAGRIEQNEQRKVMVVQDAITVKQDDAMLIALPSDETTHAHLLYELDYVTLAPIIGRQVSAFDLGLGDYDEEIASSRTFALRQEAEMMKASGQFDHVELDDALIVDDDGPMGGKSFRFEDEPVRHKMLDLIGDLNLLGCPIQGRIIARKSGHPLNHKLVEKLLEQMESQHRQQLVQSGTAIDSKRLMRILPHRYPMLLVDRVLEIDGDRRAVGIKNVTINEPFFEGHYPGTPIMPGVLIVEAMAQLSGVLIGQKIEHTGKLAVLLSLDSVKLRRPVSPGDQLVVEAEAVKIRSRIAKMRCRAYVGEDVAAEAEIKFMLVDDDQEN